MPVGTKNPQSGSASSSSSGTSPLRMKNKKALPPLFWYMEIGDWEKATDRAQRHPREVKTWTTLRTKSMADAKVSGTKRLALHHACFKLRSVVPNARTSTSEDSFVEVCKFIMLLISLYPEAAGVRESRHGCLPLHLAAFASCAPRADDESLPTPTTPTNVTPVKSPSAGIPRPHALSQRTASEGTTGSAHTNMTEIFMQENYAGSQTAHMDDSQKRDTSTSSLSPIQPNIGVSMNATVISAKRENMAVKVINALLDAYPKAIRVDSEGGRLPLHTACAGRATPRVITTLLTAYPAAARHRNKDGFLPLHLAAHWGVSHPNVAIALLKSYPDSTLGRNRWERTPLEEALCMAGENGRPHQAALVCALRKHPSYWTRTPDEVLRSEFVSERTDGPTSVDIDDSLPDDDTSYGEEIQHGSAGVLNLTAEKSKEGSGFLVRLPPLKTRKPSDVALHHVLSLPTLIKNQNWNAVRDRVAHYPHEAGEHLQAMTRGGFMSTAGFTPLHYACERRPPVEVVQALIAAWPESVTARVQPGGALPLHVACTWHASDSVLRVLTQAEPAACRIPDDLGNIPLHCAAFSGADIHVLDILLRVYPKSALARNHQGSLPGDIIKRLRHDNRKIAMERVKAATDSVVTFQHQRNRSNGSCSAVAQRAMELNTLTESVRLTPDSQQILTDADEGADELPSTTAQAAITMFASSELHKLIASKRWAEAHERIATHKAEAFKILNCDSLTDDIRRKIKAYPLHNACFLQAPGYIITALVEAFPGAVKLPDTGYRRLPIHHAILSKGYPETVAELLEKYPESAMVQDCLGRLPLHYAMFCKMPVHVVELFIRAYPAGVKVQDIKGWTPLHIAGAVSVPLPLVRSAVFACPEVLEKVDIHTFCPRDFFIVHDTVTRDVIDFLVLSTPKHIEMARDVKSLYKQMMKQADSAPSAGHHQTTHPPHESHNVAGKT